VSDNFSANPGSGGATFGSDDVGGVHYVRQKLIHGADGVNDGDVSATNPFPVKASPETGTVYNGNTALTPKFAAIAASTSGNNTLVAAVTSKKIRVLALWANANGTVNGKFQTGAGGTDLTGLLYCTAQSGIVLPFNPAGWFETAAGALLNLNLSAAIAVGGSLLYVEV
jgi:hypothetical protein